ncbi:MAG TPA: hypothetical protein PLV25_01685 [Opitutales bacterium]|nr:hypothetical protein [Opitutales bacterium]
MSDRTPTTVGGLVPRLLPVLAKSIALQYARCWHISHTAPVDAWRRPPARLGIRRMHTIGRSDDGSIDLTTGERRRHMSIVGNTGTSKSTLLPNPMADDLESGRGFSLIDPHGDFPRVARRRTDTSNFHAWVKLAEGNNPTEAIPIKTLPVAPSTAHRLGAARSHTQSRYASNWREVERQTHRIFS